MNSTMKKCRHSKEEERHICLEQQCLQKSDYKLDCYVCLLKSHSHEQYISHVADILVEAQRNKEKLISLLAENINFSLDIISLLEKDTEEMKTKINQWIDQQHKGLLEQIEKYQSQQTKLKEIVSSVQLSENELKNIVEYKLYDMDLYKLRNQQVKAKLTLTESAFVKYLQNSQEKTQKYFNYQTLDDLPELTAQPTLSQNIQYEKCTMTGCSQQEKKSFCLSQECLQLTPLALECSSCQVKKHLNDNTFDSHKMQFVIDTELIKQSNEKIELLEKQCNEKRIEIEKESQCLQQMIQDCQSKNEEKLDLYRKFIIEREKEIVQLIEKFKLKYRKDKFEIHRELFYEDGKDFATLSDIKQVETNFKQISSQFKLQFEKEKEVSQQQFQELWNKGLCQLQSVKIACQLEKFVNPISVYIQDQEKKLSQQVQENRKLITSLESQKILIQQLQEKVDSQANIKQVIQEEIQAQFKTTQGKLQLPSPLPLFSSPQPVFSQTLQSGSLQRIPSNKDQ